LPAYPTVRSWKYRRVFVLKGEIPHNRWPDDLANIWLVNIAMDALLTKKNHGGVRH
jgi:hypothetical protein